MAARACRQQDRNYSALWIVAEDLQAEGMLLSRHMLLDHFPDRALAILRRTLSQLEAAPPPAAVSGGPSTASYRSSSSGSAAGAAVGLGAASSPAALQPPPVQEAVYCRGALMRRWCLHTHLRGSTSILSPSTTCTF